MRASLSDAAMICGVKDFHHLGYCQWCPHGQKEIVLIGCAGGKRDAGLGGHTGDMQIGPNRYRFLGGAMRDHLTIRRIAIVDLKSDTTAAPKRNPYCSTGGLDPTNYWTCQNQRQRVNPLFEFREAHRVRNLMLGIACAQGAITSRAPYAARLWMSTLHQAKIHAVRNSMEGCERDKYGH